MTPKFSYSEDQLKFLLDGIFDGSITEYDIPEELYLSIADYLKSGLYKGFGGTLSDFSGKDLELLTELRTNIYAFSGGKCYQQIKDYKGLLFNEDGELRSAREFTQLGEQAFETWNEAWGLTERNTAVSMAQSASKWNEIQANKDLLPNLTYSTIGDACDICAPLDGFTAPVDDKVWNSIYPVNHFNCLCIVEQNESDVPVTPDEEKETIFDTVTGNMDDTFKMNPGKDKVIFSDSHPYFDVPKKDQEYAANNFNLPIPKTDEE